jgi:hypothetical protein
MKEAYERSHHRFAGIPGLPCAMVLTVSFVLAPETGLVASVTPEKLWLLEELDIGVGISGPHDFAVRCILTRQLRTSVHRIPRPTSVTIGQTPL